VERVTLNSSAIEAVTYDENRCTLIVEFRDGDRYQYFNAAKMVYDELFKAESTGAYWNRVKEIIPTLSLTKSAARIVDAAAMSGNLGQEACMSQAA